MSEKIKPHHLGRKAVLYVRQSSAHQVAHNQESRKLQYAMRKRLEQLGFQEIEIIDEDRVFSASLREPRPSRAYPPEPWTPRKEDGSWTEPDEDHLRV